MPRDPSVSPQAYQYFEQESAELMQLMESELQALRHSFSVQKVHNLMRAAHTLKGASASVGLDSIKKITHSLEDIFGALCYDDTVISPPMERLLFEGFECLQRLMSAQLAGAKIDEADSLDRMALVVTQLQAMLGDRFGQGGRLPSSTELGFDMTQSIFEVGVAQRIATLSEALESPNPEALVALLQTQGEVFIGLGESLGLPGFKRIAQMTLRAIQLHPEQILTIAPVALEDFSAAHAAVLEGDRTQGGVPSAALKQLCDRKYRPKAPPAKVDAPAQAAPQTPQGNWLTRRWHKFTHTEAPAEKNKTQPTSRQSNLETPGLITSPTATPTTSVGPTATAQSIADPQATPLVSSAATEPTDTEFAGTDLAELAPTELETLNIQPQKSETVPELPLPATRIEETGNTPASPLQSVAEASPAEPASAQFTNVSNQRNTTGNTVGKASSNATIRMSIEHLDQLSQAMGELLTEQNRQTLYNEQLTGLVKKLLNRISKQQQQLNQQKNQALTRKIFESKLSQPEAIGPSNTNTNAPYGPLFYDNFDDLELDQYSDIQLFIQSCLEESVQQSESAEAIELFVRRSGQTLEKQKRLLANTRETLLEARMVPLSIVFNRFPAVVERLQAQYQKEVELVLEGGDILVDKTIAETLYDPLLHLIRNAFDHGIESPKERLLQGKLIGGTITLKGAQQGRHLLISVEDDGQGIDLGRIRRKALENQLITPEETATLTRAQTTDLLFESGFSTAGEANALSANALSGRGIGLSAVQARARSLQGRVSITQVPKAGTTFTLQIPASLTIAKLLLCQAEGRIYALIADAIEHILMPTPRQVREWKGGKMLTWQANNTEHLVPVNALNEVLHYASPMSERQLRSPRNTGKGNTATGNTRKKAPPSPVILLHHEEMLVGLEVDQLLGEQELVISPLGNTIVPPVYLYGSSILPDGQLTLVLDGLMLAKIIVEQRQSTLAAGAANRTQTEAASREPSNNKPVFAKQLILTIDDSITVRQTLAEALQKANYQVIQASDGAEALQQLEHYPDVQAILCDIEMPRMNGFEFLKARQQIPEVAAIPTIMLTSRAGDKHRALTQELGATTYLTKPYLTPQLLKTLSEAIDGQTQGHAQPASSSQSSS
ncbi:MAG: hybrid sensor histidine kinase/response regulator [Cyanobacteria bacterium J06649_5]